jgi:GDP-D-mannose dehydratase
VQCDGVGVFNCLEAIRQVLLHALCFFTPTLVCSRTWQSGIESTVRFYQASTSELYGKIQVVF